MNLRAVIVGIYGPQGLGTGHRAILSKLLDESIVRYPPDAEVPTSESPVPASTIAVSKTSTEGTFSAEPWDDPPLSGADWIICFEGPDAAALQRTAELWQKGSKGISQAVTVLTVEVRDRLYTSPTIASVAYDHAIPRQGRSVHPEVLLWPFQRTDRWWDLSPLQRQALFLPMLDAEGNVTSPGHIEVSAPLVSIVHRRLYHHPVPEAGVGTMLGWFETSPEQASTLRTVVEALQDVSLTPDHAYYRCGPLWWGRRVPVGSLVAQLVANS